ncbi:MAG: GNAT family N-acetyltransferase [Acidobacteriaceae bacterium]|nr:GNAT family N-acetyltransferase [Acidobacteriaceae bacterium]
MQQQIQTLEDLGGASALIRRSWLENKDQTLDYNAAFLASSYAYPGTDLELSPAIYDDRRNLIAFVSAFPRRVVWNGQFLRLALLTFFTVAPEAKGRGLGKAVWAECLERARGGGYDGAIHYCVVGNKSNFVTVAAARSIGLTSERVFTIKYLMRPLKAPELASESADAAGAEILFRELAAELPSKARLCRSWSEDEIHWNCSVRYGGITEVHPSGRGLLTAYVLNTANTPPVGCLFIEDLLWDDLTADERAKLFKRMLDRAGAKAQIAVAPLWGYSDTEPFVKAGFRRSTRAMHMYLTLWNRHGLNSSPLPMYIDVY